MAGLQAFPRLPKGSKREWVIREIQQALQKGLYRPGQKLPPEADIAQQLGVSRATVREALSALQLAGMVEIHHGDGVYVRSTRPVPSLLAAPSGLTEEELFQKAVEVRRVIEAASVRWASRNATPHDWEKIDACLRQMEAAVTAREYEQYLDANLSFHLAIAAAAKNPVLEHVLHYLITLMGLAQGLRLHYYLLEESRLQEAFHLHREIFEALRRRDPEAAQRAMAVHFDRFMARFSQERSQAPKEGGESETLSRTTRPTKGFPKT